jgi:FkbM family methyltransferase
MYRPVSFVQRYFHNKKNGFYIDVGAYDGITYSNTLDLDNGLSWKGICIEPIPEIYDKLVKNRSNAECINVAAGKENKDVEFWHVEGYAEMLSGIASCYDGAHIARINNEIKRYGGSIKKIKINIIMLKDIINKPVDYLSIDAEGSELNVIKGLDIYSNRPKLISLEDNGYTNDPFLFLESNGYKRLQKVCGDVFYESIDK